MRDAASRMDRMYAWQTPIYDWTRAPYLLGRDLMIEGLAPPPGGRILEIGCGTGRNLVAAARRWPQARLYGLNVSSVMIRKARDQTARAGLAPALAQGDATSFDAAQAFGVNGFDRIFFSYALSMIPRWEQALAQACGQLAPAGRLAIVDFGDGAELPPVARSALRAWLRLFDVAPRDELAPVLRDLAASRGLRAEARSIRRGYAVLASVAR
ncbi:MAG TPA: class I SAM-dependent methyltransferase [Beijerinckiaceae bacterium]